VTAPGSRADRFSTWGPRAAFVPLRAFLGGTFVFAGLQKLANPNFFNRASPISIWSQLAGAERTSPLHGLLGHLLHVATPLGLLIAAGEVAVGLGILLGLLTRVASAGGMLLSFGLFLTVSFHSDPYYTGADIVFFFALSPLLLAGPGPLLALDPPLRRRAIEVGEARSARMHSGTGRGRPGPRGPGAPLAEDFVLARRQLLSRAAAVVGTVGLAAMGLDGLIGRLVGGVASPSGTPQLGAGAPASPTTATTTATTQAPPTRAASPTTATTRTAAPPTTATATTAAPPTSRASANAKPPGTALGPAKEVPLGGAATFTDPASGDPGLVIQPVAGHFIAFDAICPHAGCTVGYSAPDRLIVCPCHGSEFNPSTGAVIAGPAPRGLRPIQLAEGANGQLYAV